MEDQISKRKFRHFIYHLARAESKLADIDQGRIKLGKQIEKTKTVSLDREKKVVIENSFDKLQKQLNDLLQKEGFLVSQHAEESKKINELTNRVNDLQKRLDSANKDKEIIEQLKLNLAIANQKLTELMKIEQEREAKITKLEERMKQKSEDEKKNGEKKALLKQLEELEEKYYQLKYSGQHDDALLEKLNDRISVLKKQLEV